MGEKKKRDVPVTAIVITIVLTAAVMLGGFYFMGFHVPHGSELSQGPVSLAEDKSVQLWTCGMHPWIITEAPGQCPICGMNLVPKAAAKDTPTDAGERKIVYWRAPMDPLEIHDAPGKSKMGMDLIPVYEDELVGGVDVIVDPVTRQNMGIRTAVVEKGLLEHNIRTYGHITYDETRMAQVSPKVDGWIEQLHVNFTGEGVEKGDPLLEIYSPQLLSAQEEYLSLYHSLKDSRSSQTTLLLESSRRRLSYFDVAEEEIHAMEVSGQVKKTVMIRSPFSGVVTLNLAVQGGYVKAGTTLYNIADLSRVWVDAHIYEYELDQVKVGQDAQMSLPYLPGKLYRGKVTFVYPYLQEKTRDVVIRLEFDNSDMELKPQMYGDVRIKTGGTTTGIMVPSESVLRSGERNVAFISRPGGKFTPREVQLGMALDDNKVQVLTGLAPGEIVVTSGQFLLDSESKLQEAVKKMVDISRKTPGDEGKTPDNDLKEGTSGAGQAEDDFFKEME